MEGVLEATFDGGRKEVCFARIVGTDLILQTVGQRLSKSVLSLVRARLEDLKDETRFVLVTRIAKVIFRAQMAFEAVAWMRALQERIIR